MCLDDGLVVGERRCFSLCGTGESVEKSTECGHKKFVGPRSNAQRTMFGSYRSPTSAKPIIIKVVEDGGAGCEFCPPFAPLGQSKSLRSSPQRMQSSPEQIQSMPFLAPHSSVKIEPSVLGSRGALTRLCIFEFRGVRVTLLGRPRTFRRLSKPMWKKTFPCECRQEAQRLGRKLRKQD